MEDGRNRGCPVLSEIRIYVEGGRTGKQADMRRAFNDFFAVPLRGANRKSIHWQIIPSGSRNDAYNNFCNAFTDHPNAVNLLLVDAEDQVTDFGKVWDHLKTRDGWENPGVGDDRGHLMVCTMEAWFVADHETLARYFHKDIDKVPEYANVEGVSKGTIEALMTKVSTGPGHHAYEKIRDGIRLLSRIRPAIVQAKAPHCRRLFETLDAIIGAL